MLKKHVFWIALSLLSLNSCINLPIYKAHYAQEFSQEVNGMQGYDKESKITWALQQNEDFFELHFQTDDKTSILRLLQSGTNIYLDPTGKKKRNISIEYPLKSEAPKSEVSNSMETNFSRPNRTISRKSKSGMQKMLNTLNQQIIFNHNGTTEILDYKNQGSRLYIHVYYEDENTLHYIIRVPKSEFLNGEYEHATQFSLGLIANGIAPSSGPNSMRAPSMNNTNQNISRNGGSRGGSRGGSPGMRGSMGGNRPNLDRLTTPINIWFTVDLTKK